MNGKECLKILNWIDSNVKLSFKILHVFGTFHVVTRSKKSLIKIPPGRRLPNKD